MVYARVGYYHQSYLLIYIDDLSNELALCKSGCYINEQCMNYVIYADDICLLAPSAIGLQQMLDVCLNFSICNDIIFNPVKSVCIAFQPKKSKLFCPNVTLDNNVLEYIGRTKYLGFMFNSNGQDDEDMLRQMRNLYIRSNKLLRTFHYCSSDVKLELFKSYCTSFYCCYLWTAYKKSTFDTGYLSYIGSLAWNYISSKIPTDVSYICFKNYAKLHIQANSLPQIRLNV